VNSTVSEDRLPSTVDGLIAFAGGVMRSHWLLFFALSLFVFAAEIVPWLLVRATSDMEMDARSTIINFAGIFAQALPIGAVAIAANARATSSEAGWRITLGLALDRWLAVIGATMIVQFLALLFAAPLLADPSMGLFALVLAPIVCLLWGIISFAGPLAAMSSDRPGIAFLSAGFRAIRFGLAPPNLGRTAYIGVLSISPILLAFIITTAKHASGTGQLYALLGAGLDALTTVPIAALASAVVLDFIRRAENAQK
jgi:hypothetical protein